MLGCETLKTDPELMRQGIAMFVQTICEELERKCRSDSESFLKLHKKYSVELQCSETGYSCDPSAGLKPLQADGTSCGQAIVLSPPGVTKVIIDVVISILISKGSGGFSKAPPDSSSSLFTDEIEKYFLFRTIEDNIPDGAYFKLGGVEACYIKVKAATGFMVIRAPAA
jgi:hypothetical protein